MAFVSSAFERKIIPLRDEQGAYLFLIEITVSPKYLVPIARDRGSPAAGGAIDGHQRATRDTAFSLFFGSGSHLTPCWSKPDSNSRSHPLTRRQTDGSDPPHLPIRQIYRSRSGASGCERTAA